MRLTFRPKATKPSAGLIRFAQVPTPVEVVTGDEVASTQTQNTMVWLGRSPMDSALRLPGLGAASGSGGSELRVPTWVGVTSVIETTQDLGAKDWREVGRIVGDGTVAGWPVTVSDPGQGYYRVRWEP